MSKILVTLVLALRIAAQENAIPAAQREALLDLYASTNGPQWKFCDGWGGPAGTECRWEGVSCRDDFSTDSLSVSDLFLENNNLNGILPASVCDLDHLEMLIVTNNSLRGPLPQCVLERLDAGKLALSGYAGQFSPIVEIDYSFEPSAVICGDYQITMKANGEATMAKKICRNENIDDRATFWEHSRGYLDADRIARVIETSGFASLEESYARNQTHGATETLTVTYRDGTRKVVSDYAASAPAPMWLIKTLIAGEAFNGFWETTTRSKPVNE